MNSDQDAACKQRGDLQRGQAKETPINFPCPPHPSRTPTTFSLSVHRSSYPSLRTQWFQVVLMFTNMNCIAPSGARPVQTNGTPSGLEQNSYIILAAAGARVYHTKLQATDNQWSYSHWKGTLTLGRDLDTPQNTAQGTTEVEKHWFRLADVETGRTVWIFKFPENFEYELDRPFFHVFQGRVYTYDFLT